MPRFSNVALISNQKVQYVTESTNATNIVLFLTNHIVDILNISNNLNYQLSVNLYYLYYVPDKRKQSTFAHQACLKYPNNQIFKC